MKFDTQIYYEYIYKTYLKHCFKISHYAVFQWG
jgi:hypothetical protein